MVSGKVGVNTWKSTRSFIDIGIHSMFKITLSVKTVTCAAVCQEWRW